MKITQRDGSLLEIRLELFEAQNEIIRLQSECIDELFRLLCLHMGPEELSSLPAVGKINRAAALRAEHEL